MITKFFWKVFKNKFVQYHINDLKEQALFTDLEYRWTDSKGLKYYGFSDKLSISFDRFGKLQEYLIWWANGLTDKALTSLLDVADKAIENGVVKLESGKRVNMIKIAAILHEIRERKDMIRPVELIYNIIACQLVREDENPFVYNEKIHLQKVVTIKEEVSKHNAFFLQWKEYKMLFGSMNMSNEEFMNYIQKSSEIHKALKEKIDQFL